MHFLSDPNDRKISDILQEAYLSIGNSDFCKRLKSNLPDQKAAFCAGKGGGIDTCSGDSGGPLTLTNTDKTQSYVVGITSLGPSICGVSDSQGLYTSVNFYIPWILRSLRP